MLRMTGDDEEESTDDGWRGGLYVPAVSVSPLISQSKWGGRPRGLRLFSKSQQAGSRKEAESQKSDEFIGRSSLSSLDLDVVTR